MLLEFVYSHEIETGFCLEGEIDGEGVGVGVGEIVGTIAQPYLDLKLKYSHNKYKIKK